MEFVYLYIFSIIITSLWLCFEAWRAPLLDENYNTIVKEKTFKDLLKKLKLWK
jgi:hypothetical protein